MTNEEHFKNWGEEYRQTAADLKDRIKKLKIQRGKLQGDDALILEGKITSLAESYYDCLDAMKILFRHAEREKSKALRTKNCV